MISGHLLTVKQTPTSQKENLWGQISIEIISYIDYNNVKLLRKNSKYWQYKPTFQLKANMKNISKNLISCILIVLTSSICLSCHPLNQGSSQSYALPIKWHFSKQNPVITPGQLHGDFDAKRVSCCSVLQLGDIYRMYYWAEDNNGHYYIAQAEAPISNPTAWKAKGIVLERQPDKPHNSQGPCYAQVIPQDDGPWLMYVCTWGTARPDGKLPYATHLVTSQDQGKTWQYYSDEPIFPHTEWWNKEGTGSVCVLRDGDIFRAYFTSFAEYKEPPAQAKSLSFHAAFSDKIPSVGIGYAESKDGINWYYPLNRWAATARGFHQEYYEYLLSKPWVIKDGKGYRMWCGALGIRYRVRSLTSTDALNWTFQDEWFFEDADLPSTGGIGQPGNFDDIQRSYPMVIKQADEYHMWYTGNWFGQAGKGYTTGMGFAVGRTCP